MRTVCGQVQIFRKIVGIANVAPILVESKKCDACPQCYLPIDFVDEWLHIVNYFYPWRKNSLCARYLPALQPTSISL
jgi:hypothetical protein